VTTTKYIFVTHQQNAEQNYNVQQLKMLSKCGKVQIFVNNTNQSKLHV